MSHSPRPQPTETIHGLSPPLAEFPYLSGADDFRFEPTAEAYSPINAWWMADASFLVYGDAEFIERAMEQTPLPALGFELAWVGTREENRGMVLSNDQAMIVVFRGTRLQQHSVLDSAEVVLINQDDLWTDSKFLKTACAAGGMVHQGFLSGFAEISDVLDEIVAEKKESQSLWFAGHSLGGALAVIAATHLADKSVQGVYTYGAPRVGNEEFANVLPEATQQRLVHRDDWVPTVPPELIGYRHGGVLRQLDGSGPRSFMDDVTHGAQSLLTAAKSMARELKIDLGQLPMKISGLADHAPVYYATLLWNELVQPSAS